ncbi:uncharacterized protein LOC119090682, partial [Pollicipes pollicipes]|uniref:uncharacterized protein LOC119090682 n=1 Tax=Pollicipes pollicipes TaxID=41117 RepID=UPI0018856F37
MFAAIRGRNRSESPTRFSEISLRRYKKNVRSKKNSAAAMSADEEAVVGHRSVSMSTLSLNGANSTKSDQQKPSISQLATVEAKMAGIENSLAATNTQRRKKDAVLSGPRDLIKELELLHNTLKEKDQLILSLRSQVMSVCQRHASQEAERAAKERERTLLLERLTQLQTQTDKRRAHVKNLRLSLEKLETSENIDACIRQAELEYELEREELNILNLQGEQITVRAKIEDAEGFGSGAPGKVSLSSCLPSGADTSLHLVSLQYETRSPSFTVNSHASGVGVLVEWSLEGSGLRKGDRLLELNGQHVFGHRKETFLQLLGAASEPLRLLVVRCQP